MGNLFLPYLLVCSCFCRVFHRFGVYSKFPKACNSHFVIHFYASQAGYGNRKFPRGTFPNVRFWSYRTIFEHFFLRLEKVHKISIRRHDTAIFALYIPATTVVSAISRHKFLFQASTRRFSHPSVTNTSRNTARRDHIRRFPLSYWSIRRTHDATSSPAWSISAAVVPCPNERRIMVRAISAG